MRILLAEDDFFFQNFYSKKLAEKGFEVDLAKNGVEAIEKIGIHKPDVMLLDLIMPEKDGFEVLKAVRQDENLKGLPILVFSTLGQEVDIEKAISLGASGYINKTFFDFDNLLSRIMAVAEK